MYNLNMAVYLDNERNSFGRMIMCHMIADSLNELHQMADLIGMRRAWFQPRSTPHYDVSLSRRVVAIRYGAIVLDRRPFVMKLKEVRPQLIQEYLATKDHSP